MNSIITIGREYGSGGREIGIKLSEQLGCPFFDKEIINETAKMNLPKAPVLLSVAALIIF